MTSPSRTEKYLVSKYASVGVMLLEYFLAVIVFKICNGYLIFPEMIETIIIECVSTRQRI